MNGHRPSLETDAATELRLMWQRRPADCFDTQDRLNPSTPEKMGKRQSTQTERVEALATVRPQSDGRAALYARAEQAEGDFARFFDQSLDLLCVTGFDGYFKRLNQAWTTCLGWTEGELQARPFLDFVHPEDHKLTLAEVDRLGEDGVTVLFENRYRHRDGSYRWLQWNARSLGGSQRIYAAARDVTRLKRLEREVLDIADREQERLGRELHDGLCQTLAGIAALTSTLAKRLAASSDSAGSATAEEIAQLLRESIGQARDLARGLGPIGLKAAGLDEALETLALNFERMFHVSCTLECDGLFLGLPYDVKANLYRIAQEAAHNAVAHGRADQIEIGLRGQDGKGVLTVRDNGVGIPEAVRNAGGIGLHTMAYRARLIGASLQVRRGTRRGTVVTCAFPLPETPDIREKPDHERSND